MWDLVPWPGIDSGPPTWERGVLASRPPGKSQIHCLLNIVVVTSPLDHEDLIHHCFIHLCVPILYNSESTHTHTGHLLIIVASISIYWVWRQWYPTPVLLPGKSRGWRSLVGYSPWGRWGSGTTWATSLSVFTFMHWRRKWQPTPVFLPGESQGWGSLVGCCLWGRTESDTTEVT